MLRIRLRKVGKKNQPSYRLVVCEQRSKPQGKYLENLGFYNPRTKKIKLHKEQILSWLKKGAQASATAHNLLVSQGVIKAAKRRAWYAHRKKEAAALKPTEAKKEEAVASPKQTTSESVATVASPKSNEAS